MNAFWSNFWPNLASTLIGVIVGVPVALWLNALAGRRANRERRSVEREYLRHGLQTVAAAMAHNSAALQLVATTFAEGKVIYELGLDTVAWEASRHQVAPVLKNPELYRRIALHFGGLSALAKLSSTYLDLGVGVGSALMGAAKTRETLRQHLISMSSGLISDAQVISNDIQTLLGSIDHRA